MTHDHEDGFMSPQLAESGQEVKDSRRASGKKSH